MTSESENASLALLTGDATQAVAAFRRLHDQRVGPTALKTCLLSGDSTALLLGDAYRKSGDETRAQEMYRSVDGLAANRCGWGADNAALKEAARRRLEAAPKPPDPPRP